MQTAAGTATGGATATTAGTASGSGGSSSGTAGTTTPSRWIAVAAGDAHTCGIADDGTLWCWGDDGYGAAGPEGLGDRVLEPVRVSTFSDWTAVAAGGRHTCGLRSDGRAYCFGDDASGQLGLGGAGPGPMVPAPTEVAGGHRFSALAAGDAHTCGIAVDGMVLCWGGNDAGQLGTGTTGGTSDAPVAAATTDAFAGISAGSDHTCAFSSGSGSLRCWGANGDGQVGDGNPGGPVAMPSPVVSPIDGWTAVAGGGAHTCGVASGIVYCWGSRSDGQVGDGMTGAPPATSPLGLPVALAGDGVAAAGEAFSCLLDEGSGALACWGRGDRGQLGDGQAASRPTPADVPPVGWTAVAAGARHACALDTDGALWCWGANDAGQLGTGDLDDRHAPAPIGA